MCLKLWNILLYGLKNTKSYGGIFQSFMLATFRVFMFSSFRCQDLEKSTAWKVEKLPTRMIEICHHKINYQIQEIIKNIIIQKCFRKTYTNNVLLINECVLVLVFCDIVYILLLWICQVPMHRFISEIVQLNM